MGESNARHFGQLDDARRDLGERAYPEGGDELPNHMIRCTGRRGAEEGCGIQLLRAHLGSDGAGVVW